MPTIWKNAPPACESAFPWSRSFPERTSGIAADFTASATRTTAWDASSPTISAVAPAVPSVESFPSGSSTSPATTPTTAAVSTLVHHTTRRRWNRSITTPMNGEIRVYGT